MAKKGDSPQPDDHIGVRELKNELTKVVKSVREDQREYVVTVHGKPVAILRPYTEGDAAQRRQKHIAEEFDEMQKLADRVTAAWKSRLDGQSILEQMREESAWR